MYLPAITAAYWRTIKRGGRTFESVPAELKAGVTALAGEDLTNGAITPEKYAECIGMPKEV
ncbi:MAG: hypothetical protein VB035_06225 [Candidatus Fimivivens sp.]|nr:hypothetical protein [Candidatus Fimivivens sp.]